MSDDLVKRLRESRTMWENARGVPSDLEREAADTIAALTAERDRLREMIANVQRVREHEHRRAENAIAERDDAFIRGMAAGQAAMPKGTLTVMDGPELERAKATIAALTARAERAEAALAATKGDTA